MVYKVGGNPQLDSRDWSMYSNILNMGQLSFIFRCRKSNQNVNNSKLFNVNNEFNVRNVRN